jgi:hypothetical protein
VEDGFGSGVVEQAKPDVGDAAAGCAEAHSFQEASRYRISMASP